MKNTALIRKRKAILVIFIPLSIPLTFILFLMIRQEIREHIYYGQIKEAKVLEIEGARYSGSKGGGVPAFNIEMKSLESDKFYYEIIKVNFQRESPIRRFKNEVEVGDTVTIKVLNESQAKILEHKKREVQPYNSYSNLFWFYLVILFLLGLVVLPYYVLIKYGK
ncbi:hypothetical protein QYS48_10225 [Marivirga arenosa]|uniref:DUF3592 domain-containing protein n=1 Tax=Marivirga arenosa TaxID=3059076 RepID=A0AA49GH82_9BACT|nr:hypothetical protein [Marivirga sp. ABR2-2]WKK87146.2 hypothetical protein QYS48_10225 [Marivirga sp. ABR2-2]